MLYKMPENLNMSDFTKEELFDLQSCVILWGINGKKDKEYLNKKLQLMIDNFCEHEKSTWGKLCDGYGNEFVGIKVCDNCHEVINDNQ